MKNGMPTMHEAKKLYRAMKKTAAALGHDAPASLRRMARAHYGRGAKLTEGKLQKILRP